MKKNSHSPKRQGLRKRIPEVLFWLAMYTWCLPQTLAGLVLLRKYRNCPRERYHNAVVVYHNDRFGGVSLGGYTFVNGHSGKRRAGVRAHEYGHCIQSLMLGPLYFLVIALPSALWCNLGVFVKMRKNKGISYYRFFTERWANSLVKRIIGDTPEND